MQETFGELRGVCCESSMSLQPKVFMCEETVCLSCANAEGLGQGVDIGVIQPTGFYGDA